MIKSLSLATRLSVLVLCFLISTIALADAPKAPTPEELSKADRSSPTQTNLTEPPYVTNHPDTLVENMCSSIYYDFFGESPESTVVSFSLISGPGTMNIDGEWNYNPGPGDIGTYTLLYQVCDDFGCSENYTTEVLIVNDPPVIVRPCDTIINGIEEDHILYFIDAIGPEQCDEVSYTLSNGPGSVDPATGVYSWETDETSIGTWPVVVGAIDGLGANSSCEFTVSIAPKEIFICGDANGDAVVNVGDAVFLINFIFKGGPAPNPVTSGDANEDGTTNVGDAVYIINYVFKGGPPPCVPISEEPCCSSPPCLPNVVVPVTYKKVPSTKTNCGGKFGLWQGYRPTATYHACCKNAGTWQMRVTGCEATYSISICTQGRTDINEVDDVTSLADCKKVVADPTYKGPRAPVGRQALKDYVSTACTGVHEQTHQDEWKASFDAAWATAEPLIEALETPCVVPSVDTPEEAVQVMKADAKALLKAAGNAAWANYPKHGPPDASGAYAADKECTNALLIALRLAWDGC